MESYTTLINAYTDVTKNTGSTNVSRGQRMMNENYRQILGKRQGWPFLQKTRPITLAASTQFYPLAYDTAKVESCYVTVGSKRYTPRESPSFEHWNRLNLVDFTSDFPTWFFVLDGQIGLFPKPASAGNILTTIIKRAVVDLNIADYVAGTITTVASGSASVVGSGTVWTSQMIGRYMQITSTNAVNTGDGLWYEISAVADTTHLTLTRNYGGSSISAGSANYTIGQMPILPENYHPLIWYGAAFEYWSGQTDPENRSEKYLGMYTHGIKNLIREYSSKTTGPVVDYGGSKEIINPNLTVSL